MTVAIPAASPAPADRRIASAPLLFSALAVALTPAAAVAMAAEAEAGAADIIVNAQRLLNANPNANAAAPYKVERSADRKYTEPLRDTPKTIIAIPKEVIEDIGATSFREVVRSTPGVTLGTGEGGNAFGDRIFIRGFEARNDVYIDGMRDPGVNSREVFAVEQIEVVKGPSSAFGGRGTTGGSVSLQSKQPGGANFVVAEGQIGTENHGRATIDLNQQLSNTLATRVSGLYHHADTPGRNHVETTRKGFAAAIDWQPADGFEFNADYYYYRMDGVPDYGHPFDVATQQPFKVDRNNFYGAIGRDFIRNGADISTLQMAYEPSDSLRLRSQSRYGETFNRYVVSVPRAPCRYALTANNSCPASGTTLPLDQWTVAAGTAQRNADNRYFAYMTDAQLKFATGAIRHTAVIGFEYANERVTARRYAFPAMVEDAKGNIVATGSAMQALNLLDPDPVLGFDIPASLAITPAIVTRVETKAIYALDTLKFGEQWEALVGIRYDDYAIRQTQDAGFTVNNAGASVPVAASRLTNCAHFLNYQASVVYKPVDEASIYGSFSTSSNPTGEQLDGSNASYDGIASSNQNLKPERNQAVELGAKYELNGGKLLLSGAIYQITKKNARDQVAPGVYDTIGVLRARGLELGVNGNLTRRWAVFGGYTYLDARVRKAANPVNEGARFPNVPRHTLSLLTTYAVTDRLTIGGQANYRDAIYGGALAPGSAKLPGYWRFDAVARYRPTSWAEVRLNVLNLIDKVYYDAIYRSGTPFSYIAPGRSATLSLTLKY